MGLTLFGMDKMMRGELLDEFADALKKWRIQHELEELSGFHVFSQILYTE